MGLRLAVLAFALHTLSVVTGIRAGESSPRPADQRDYRDSPNGCAPATVLNLLRFGGGDFGPVLDGLIGADDGVKMRFLVDRYFRHRPSTTQPARKRWGAHGVACEDLAAGVNELLAEHELPPLSAVYLDRKEDEAETDHLARVTRLVSRSLSAGTPPIVNLRSFVVKRNPENGGEPQWETGVSHFLLVTSIRGTPSSMGCELEVIDPWKGLRTAIYLHREANGRDFLVLKGDFQTGAWKDGQPFLQVLAPEVPTVRPANVGWADRYLLVANHLIGRF